MSDFRKPSFTKAAPTGAERGQAVHRFMQFAAFDRCSSIAGIQGELERMVDSKLLSAEQAQMVDYDKILPFFSSDLAKHLCDKDTQVLREFKFSILVDAAEYFDGVAGEEILLQGVVDCAWVQKDGITVLDFKTDYVTDDNLQNIQERYSMQVKAYSKALEKIFGVPVKRTCLYLFFIGKFIEM